jgi:sigma-B regulation protein RsbU (phosphoserine phosphatase)
VHSLLGLEIAMLKLVGTDGTKFYSWELIPGKYELGRSAERDFFVPHSTVSRHHAEIEVSADGKQVYLTDLGSHNGTTVDGVRVSERLTVKQNAMIAFGAAEFKVVRANQIETEKTRPAVLNLGEADLEKSVVLPLQEAMKPLPDKVADLPNVLPTLFETARMLGSSAPEDEMLRGALGNLAKVIPAERLAVLFTADNELGVYPVATVLPQGKDPGNFTLSRTVVSEVLSQQNSLLITDSGLDPRFSGKESIIRSALKSAMAVPLFDEGKVLGILYVDTSNPLHLYTDDYLRLLALFGNMIASRLVNNALLKERYQKELMDAELQRAMEIQEQLLISEYPKLDGYQVHAFLTSSREVGGDLYEVAVLQDGSLLFLVADVSGKGMGAALLMSNILASVRIYCQRKDVQLLEAVQLVSEQLCRYSRSTDFATLFIGRLDPETHKINYVNAGHNAPYLVRTDGTIEELEASGVMVGAFDFASWEEEETTLEPGDLLFIYTDGVTEAETVEADMYSEERLQKLLQAERSLAADNLAARVNEDIKAFVKDAPSSDDITMLILKRKRGGDDAAG